MTPRIHAARISARMLLRQLWQKSDSDTPLEVLHVALDAAATQLGLTVERVPAILGDNQIAGVLDRPSKRIELATKFRLTSQRFTCAHEIGHFMLHPGKVYFRDRELSAPGLHRDYAEIEADAFAADFLMPRNFLNKVFREMFGEPIDGRVPKPDFQFSIDGLNGNRNSWSPAEFASLSDLTRASIVAAAHSFRGRNFASLTQKFGVSRKAMGIQLLRIGLVK